MKPRCLVCRGDCVVRDDPEFPGVPTVCFECGGTGRRTPPPRRPDDHPPDPFYAFARTPHGAYARTPHGLRLRLRLDISNHSPCGFNWGYAGSGAAQLALAILADHTRRKPHPVLYQDFKRRVVARVPGDAVRWKMSTAVIDSYIDIVASPASDSYHWDAWWDRHVDSGAVDLLAFSPGTPAGMS